MTHCVCLGKIRGPLCLFLFITNCSLCLSGKTFFFLESFFTEKTNDGAVGVMPRTHAQPKRTDDVCVSITRRGRLLRAAAAAAAAAEEEEEEKHGPARVGR